MESITELIKNQMLTSVMFNSEDKNNKTFYQMIFGLVIINLSNKLNIIIPKIYEFIYEYYKNKFIKKTIIVETKKIISEISFTHIIKKGYACDTKTTSILDKVKNYTKCANLFNNDYIVNNIGEIIYLEESDIKFQLLAYDTVANEKDHDGHISIKFKLYSTSISLIELTKYIEKLENKHIERTNNKLGIKYIILTKHGSI
jgi:hypothetical protein